jgi:DNA-binding NarL/FixJ family response regulator
MTELLEAEPGLQVVGEAASGEQALELVELLHPDVVVIDAILPRLSGIEATRLIHRSSPEVRIVGISPFSERPLRHEMERAGASAFVALDLLFEDLAGAIRRIAPKDDR